MRTITVTGNETIQIGRRGENQATQIIWTNILENWRTMYGDGVVQLAVRRPNDTDPYPAACEVIGNDIMWTIQAADTAQNGAGECELSYIVDAVLVKSQTWDTMIARSLTGDGTVDPPSEPSKTWFSKIQSEIGNLEDLGTGDKSNLVAAINEVAQSVGGSTSDHTKLKNRDADNQHPMSAITGLTDALAGKQPTGNYLTRDDLQDATDKALAQAKASGEFDGATGPAGADGGWYTPAVTQPDESTLRVAFTPSKEDMPAVADTDITIPGGGGGSVPKPLTYDYMPEGYPTKSVGTVTLMEEQELEFSFSSGENAYMSSLRPGFKVVEGQKYTVNWDGAEYECVCSIFNSNPVIGNLSIAGRSDNTGEPFLYMYIASQAIGQFGTLDTSASHTISVRNTAETVTPMAYDYMPEGYPKKTPETVTLIEEQELAFTLNMGVYAAQLTNAFEIVVGQTYTVNWDGTEYECVAFAFNEMSAIVLGNLSIAGSGDDTGEPFVYSYDIERDAGMFATNDTSASHTISVKTTVETVTPMAEEFLPSISALFLKSSTAGSTKKFRITVDDSGTLKATETT